PLQDAEDDPDRRRAAERPVGQGSAAQAGRAAGRGMTLAAPLRCAITRPLLVLVILALSACGSLPSLDGRPVSYALTDTDDTALGRAIAPAAAQHPGRSGIYPLADSSEALVARVFL